MNGYSNLVRLALVETAPLDQRVENLCNVYYAAGYRLAAMTVVGSDMLLLFQKAYVQTGTN